MVPYSLVGKRVWVAGHRGMVGSAIVRRLAVERCEIITVGHDKLDLRDQRAVTAWLAQQQPHAVFLAAARVGGILVNDSQPADFIYDNLAISTAVIDASYNAGVEKLLFLGSSCIYPKFAPQPINEISLLTGPLEPTNQWYAVAKIAGIKLVEAYRRQHGADFISAMPTNLYGPGDNYDPQSSHVFPAIIRKVDEAKRQGKEEIEIWGTGTVRREFLHVDDCADACVYLMKAYSDSSHINVGSGADMTILELTELVSKLLGYTGKIRHDLSKPDGTPRKLLDSRRLLDLGWKPKIDIRKGIHNAYEDYLIHAQVKNIKSPGSLASAQQ